MTEHIEGLEDIEGLPTVIGWLVILDGREARANGDGVILFTDYGQALQERGYMDTCEPATAADVERARRRFGGRGGSGR